jgi:hypothetical protein
MRGVHVHVGSQILDVEPFADSVAPVAALGAFEIYDLGGGLGERYTYADRPPTVAAYLDAPERPPRGPAPGPPGDPRLQPRHARAAGRLSDHDQARHGGTDKPPNRRASKRLIRPQPLTASHQDASPPARDFRPVQSARLRPPQ